MTDREAEAMARKPMTPARTQRGCAPILPEHASQARPGRKMGRETRRDLTRLRPLARLIAEFDLR